MNTSVANDSEFDKSGIRDRTSAGSVHYSLHPLRKVLRFQFLEPIQFFGDIFGLQMRVSGQHLIGFVTGNLLHLFGAQAQLE